VIDQKQLENVGVFKLFVTMITNDARCTCETQSSIAHGKSSTQQEEDFLYQQTGVKLRKKQRIATFGA
jgi:hypothetical protein